MSHWHEPRNFESTFKLGCMLYGSQSRYIQVGVHVVWLTKPVKGPGGSGNVFPNRINWS